MSKRFSGEPDPLPMTDLANPENHLATQIINEIVKYAKQEDRKVFGQMNIETQVEEGLNVFYQVYPGGDFFLWFVENGWFTLIALVDEKYKTLARNPVDEMDVFYKTVQTISAALDTKHGIIPEDPILPEEPPKEEDEK
jgi:hypothetical protein